MLSDFFHYSLLDGILIGSESPMNHGKPIEVTGEVISRFSIKTVFVLEERLPGIFDHDVEVRHYPLSSKRPPTFDEVNPLANEVLSQHQRKKSCWIFCNRGCDRTGCVLASSLALFWNDPEKAKKAVYEKLPTVRQSEEMRSLWRPYAEIVREISANQSKKYSPSI